MKSIKNKSKHLYRHWIILTFLVFCIWSILIFIIILKNENRKQSYLDSEIKSFTSKITSILGSYENFSNYIFYENRHKFEIEKIMKEAFSSDELKRLKLKEELGRLLKSDYETLAQYGFNQFNFIFPTGESFLKFEFEQKSKFFFNYKNAKISNTEKKYLESFEFGNFYSSYRYVYILIADEEYAGVIEISIPLTNLVKVFSNFYPNINTNYLIKNTALNNLLKTKDKDKLFKNEYLFNQFTSYFSIKNNEGLKGGNEEIYFEQNNKKINKKLKKDTSFGMISEFNGKKYTSLFIPIKGKNSEVIGYLVSSYENIQYSYLHDNFYTEFILINMLMIVSLIGAFIFIKDRNKFREMSIRDYLTGMFNRSKFLDFANYELEKSARYGGGLSILLIDIDYFKKINDTYGHNTGDHMLQLLSNVLKQSIRKTDTIARWGGEEFICLLPDTEINEAEKVAQKIRKNIENSEFPPIGKITVSIGVHEKSLEDFTVESIVEKSDLALYNAKHHGRNRVSKYSE